MTDVLPPRPHDVWRDLDPRGGPTFRVLTVSDSNPRSATVVNLDGKRPRRVLLDRFRAHPGYRSGYTLVSRETDP